MKAFGIFTVIALTALINGSSALWCECKHKDPFIDMQDVGASWKCCEDVMNSKLMDSNGVSLFGLTPRDWCDTSRDKVEAYKKCCDGIPKSYGYCK